MSWMGELDDPRELRRCIRDLVALSTLPAIWTCYNPQEIADSGAAALVSMLEADFIYIAVPMSREQPMIEVAHVGKKSAFAAADAIRRAIAPEWSRGVGQTAVISNPMGEGTARIATAPIGFSSGAVLVAGSAHADFPTETQRLLLSIAANDTTIALQRWRAEADERRFVSLVERSSDFVAFADLDGRPQFVNAAGLELVGLSAGDDLSLRTVFDFVAPGDKERAREESWPTVVRTGRWLGELNLQHFKTGEAIPFLVDALRIDNPRNGEPMNVAAVSRDLRAQKRVEFDLQRLNESLEHRVRTRTAELADSKEKLTAEMLERRRVDSRLAELQFELSHAGRLSTAGQMAIALAHELNQPLTAVTNSANAARRLLAKDKQANIDTVREIMEEIATQSLRAGHILRRLREFVTRGESEKRVESVRTLIEEASAFARIGSEAAEVDVRVKFDPNAANVIANRIQIQQVLINVMRNAFEAMAGTRRGKLCVTTDRVDEETIEIAIADSGPGLTKEVANHLFEPFVSTKRIGVGLGLSICRTIVEAHGGKLRHEPNPEGGTIFRFTLPSPMLAGEDHAR